MKVSKIFVLILVTLLMLTTSVITFITVVGGINPFIEMDILRGYSDAFESIESSTIKTTVTIDKGDMLWQIMRDLKPKVL